MFVLLDLKERKMFIERAFCVDYIMLSGKLIKTNHTLCLPFDHKPLCEMRTAGLDGADWNQSWQGGHSEERNCWKEIHQNVHSS